MTYNIFLGEVRDWYYHAVHGAPFYSIDFKGSIGIREVKVQDIEVDYEKKFSSTQCMLHFGEPSDTSYSSSALRALVVDRGRASTRGRPKEFSPGRGIQQDPTIVPTQSRSCQFV